jgi:hypothetical protein
MLMLILMLMLVMMVVVVVIVSSAENVRGGPRVVYKQNVLYSESDCLRVCGCGLRRGRDEVCWWVVVVVVLPVVGTDYVLYMMYEMCIIAHWKVWLLACLL